MFLQSKISGIIEVIKLISSINVALEHKNPPYLSGSKDKIHQSQYLGDKKEKTSKSNLKDKRRTNGTLEGYESLYEMPSQYTRSKDLLETPKRDISGLQYPYVTRDFIYPLFC